MRTEALAAEIAPFGLYATAICPGGVRTDVLDGSSSRHPSAPSARSGTRPPRFWPTPRSRRI